MYRFTAELQADLDLWIHEYNEARPITLGFGKDADANVPRRNADDEGENDRRLTTSDTKTRPLNQALSVRSSLG
jgi:hypothetical protein